MTISTSIDMNYLCISVHICTTYPIIYYNIYANNKYINNKIIWLHHNISNVILVSKTWTDDVWIRHLCNKYGAENVQRK